MRGPKRTTRAVIALIALAAVSTIIVLSILVVRADDLADARNDAIKAARASAIDLMTYDYRSIDRDLARALSHTTSTLRTKLARDLDAHKQTFVSDQVHATAVVIQAAADVVTTNNATVLLFVNQTVASLPSRGQPQIDHARLVMKLIRVGGHWLVASLSFD